jgi:putative Mg2+ transporter-C (MgtC) family protein
MEILELFGRLALALVAGGFVGMERERRERQAGLRTHMLVCLGACLITQTSILMAHNQDDRTRIAAQIVTGIGFLGAGTIFRSGNSVRGLTTAAGLWTVAGIGMAIGAGGTLLILGLLAAAMVFGVNEWVRVAEERWFRSNEDLQLTLDRGPEILPGILEELNRRQVKIQHLRWMPDEAGADEAVLHLQVRIASRRDVEGIVNWLGQQPGVRSVELGQPA